MKKKILHKTTKLQLVHLTTTSKKFNLLNAVIKKMKGLNSESINGTDSTKV